MHLARWTAPLVGLAVVAGFAAPAPASAPTQGASTQSIVNAALLSANDVPAGWSSKKQSDALNKTLKSVSACKALASAVDAARKKATRKLSPEFADPATPGQLTAASDTVYVFKNPSDAQTLLTAFQDPSAQTCFEKAFTKAITKSVKGGQATVNVTPIKNLQGVGNGAVGYEATINVTKGSQSITLVADLVGVQVGPAFLGIELTNPDKSIPNGLVIVNSVVDRTKTAAGA